MLHNFRFIISVFSLQLKQYGTYSFYLRTIIALDMIVDPTNKSSQNLLNQHAPI